MRCLWQDVARRGTVAARWNKAAGSKHHACCEGRRGACSMMLSLPLNLSRSTMRPDLSTQPLRCSKRCTEEVSKYCLKLPSRRESYEGSGAGADDSEKPRSLSDEPAFPSRRDTRTCAAILSPHSLPHRAAQLPKPSQLTPKHRWRSFAPARARDRNMTRAPITKILQQPASESRGATHSRPDAFPPDNGPALGASFHHPDTTPQNCCCVTF